MQLKSLAFVAACFLALPAHADEESDAVIASKLTPQHGKITLQNGLATMDLPESLGYLDPQQTQTVIEKVWHNPKGDGTLGMIVPSNVSLTSRESWGTVITYNEGGHIKDDDAETINYTNLLKDMQSATLSHNEARKEQGYPTVELVGWAQPPHYDKPTHKLYWAKELRFNGSDAYHGLNYDVRILGRQGELVLTAVGGMDQLATIQNETPQILSMINFNEGSRYTDFNPSTDKLADYGLAALVAGTAGMAAVKGGLFKGLLVALVAAKKFIILAIAAVVVTVKKWLAKLRKKPSQE